MEYLLQVIHILSLLDVRLKDVEDSPDDIQHSCRDAHRGIHFTDHTIGILKLDGCQELSRES